MSENTKIIFGWRQSDHVKYFFYTGGECNKEGTQVNFTKSKQNKFRKNKMKRRQGNTLVEEEPEGKKRYS